MNDVIFKFEQYIDDVKKMSHSEICKFWCKTFGKKGSDFDSAEMVAMGTALETIRAWDEFKEDIETSETIARDASEDSLQASDQFEEMEKERESLDSVIKHSAYTMLDLVRAETDDEAEIAQEIAYLDSVAMLLVYLLTEPEIIRRFANFNIEEILPEIKKMSLSDFCEFWCKFFEQTNEKFERNTPIAKDAAEMLRSSLQDMKDADNPEFEQMVIVTGQTIVYNIHHFHLQKSQGSPNKKENYPYEALLTLIVYFSTRTDNS